MVLLFIFKGLKSVLRKNIGVSGCIIFRALKGKKRWKFPFEDLGMMMGT